jgi:SET domain-containing protein
MIFPPTKLYLKEVEGKGMGVFASDAITKGEVIETCHIYFFNPGINDNLPEYGWGFPKADKEPKRTFMPFGFGSIYNHCDNNNIDWECDGKTMKWFATRDINIDEECCAKYNERFWQYHGVDNKI